jgi:manganese transport protein
VGTLAGQAIMQDFVRFRIPIHLRRLLTMAPAFVVVALGVTVTDALVMSQVVLSLVLPVPMIALVYVAADKGIMGAFAISKAITLLASFAALVVLSLNAILICLAAGVEIPGLTG